MDGVVPLLLQADNNIIIKLKVHENLKNGKTGTVQYSISAEFNSEREYSEV